MNKRIIKFCLFFTAAFSSILHIHLSVLPKGIIKRYMIGTMACMFMLACSNQRNIGRDGYRLLSLNESNVIDSLIIDSICSLYAESYSDFIICSMGIASPEAYNILDDSSYVSSIVFVKCDSIYEYWCIARPKEAFTSWVYFEV